MEITIVQAVLIGLWTGVCLSGMLLGIYTNRCLIMATGVGLILGDLPTGLAMGAVGELAFMGFGVSQGGSVPPNPMGPGIIFQFVITLVYTAMAGVSATATKALENKQFKKFRLCCNLTVWVFLVLGFVIGFAGAMSAEGLEKVISLIPTWLNTGLSVAGAMLPAIGFAMILNVMAKKELIPFVLLGYCAIAYFKLPIIGVAILGTTVALLVHFYTGKGNKSGTETEEVEVEFEDGI